MAKVFATLLENNKVILREWSSAASFNKTESWIDEKFIYIATSEDFKEKYLSPAMFDIDEDEVHTQNKGEWNILISDNERKAHRLMFQAREEYFKNKRA